MLRLRDRLSFWKGAVHWGWLVTLGIWEVLSSVFHFRDNFLPAAIRETLDTQSLVKHWDWHVWVIGTLAIMVVAALGGCYRKHKGMLSTIEQAPTQAIDAIATKRAELRAERDTARSKLQAEEKKTE